MKHLLMVAILLACGCQANALAVAPTAIDQSAIRALWRSSPHGHTYALDKGPNTYCARCHSPRNWNPASKVDPPPNCVSCKFTFDPAPRRAASNPLVPENEWKNIGCDICHRMENGIAAQQIAWLNISSGRYEPVATPTELCEKCHTDSDVLRHKRDLGSGAHASFDCTRCHDAHSTKASCSTPACHGPLLAANASASAGHDQAHAGVDCVACHDASGLPVARSEENRRWMTLRTTELLGRSTTAAFQSHRLQRQVDCARCHYAGNPWHLTSSVKAK